MTNGSMLTLRRPDNLLETRVCPGQAVSPSLIASALSHTTTELRAFKGGRISI